MSKDLFKDYYRQFTDVNTGFRINPITKDVLQLKNETAVTQSIKNLIQTKFGEKLMDPEVGSRVYETLFEPLDAFSASKLAETIINTINNFEPRVVVNDCVVSAEDTDSYEVAVDIDYTIVGENVSIQSRFILERPGA
jgi:phage baseplate assembly protein W